MSNWPDSLAAAKVDQCRLATQVQLKSFPLSNLNSIKKVAGVDVGVDVVSGKLRAAAVLIDPITAELIEWCVAQQAAQFDYQPGYLSYRELPVVLEALEGLSSIPDIIFCDGQGIAHPRGVGIASHLGVLVQRPTIGVAKKLLFGRSREPENKLGSHTLIKYQHQILGCALRSRVNVKPIYVSPGHLITVSDATAWVMHFSRGYKLPEPTRIADRIASRRTKAWQS